MAIIISSKILTKLIDKHDVSKSEVRQCFENISGKFLFDTREKHQTDPKTMWFIAQTNKNRLLKVVFMIMEEKEKTNFIIKSAFEPNAKEIEIYLHIGLER